MALIGRRRLLGGVGAGWLADQLLPDRAPIAGQLLGASSAVGHRLREPTPRADGPAERTDVVIVGGGASGLSAAWRLRHAGVAALLLELEGFLGGTSAWSDDGVVPHPFGAHYLPVPERGARSVARLLEELGVVTGWDAAGRPLVLEEMLCHAPEERLFYRGGWHHGLVPEDALDANERAELARFRAQEQAFGAARGNDGRYAFAIPVSESSRDPAFRALDGQSMAAWLDANGYVSPFVRWHARYATLDDFGAELDDVSAWAAWHYFASRRLETPQLEGSRYLVWPEGNGWLLRRVIAGLPGELRSGALVTRVAAAGRGVEIDYLDVARERVRRVEARAAIVAAPAFIARRLAGVDLAARKASPWVVCNLHVTRPEEPDRAWDSVIHDSHGLGYVDAGHQLTSASDRTVLTYFRAYGDRDVARVRAELAAQSWAGHASAALRDLGGAHPDLADQVERIDVMVWGHAMPRPTPGFLAQGLPLWLAPGVAWAHVDQSGFALFEEASYRGVRAAEAVLDHLGAARGETFT